MNCMNLNIDVNFPAINRFYFFKCKLALQLFCSYFCFTWWIEAVPQSCLQSMFVFKRKKSSLK